jgi:hypothetical protein
MSLAMSSSLFSHSPTNACSKLVFLGPNMSAMRTFWVYGGLSLAYSFRQLFSTITYNISTELFSVWKTLGKHHTKNKRNAVNLELF